MPSKFTNSTILRKRPNNMKKPSRTFSHQKRFGQYFSGDKVAALLSLLLPQGLQYCSIIDPMVGKGDLLNAVVAKATKNVQMLGVEIDKPVAVACQKRLPQAKIICEDAFQSKAVITEKGWDLVITNPPYVRYQLQNDDNSVMPTGNAIRDNLFTLLNKLSYLDVEEKQLLLQITRNYSGLSDMAVPSWILCASLVKAGGILAMVVPETWLNREYAKPIQYLLLKAFDVLTIARDVNACWFDNALVRTCLIVAKKKKIVPLSETTGEKTLFIDLGAGLVGERSLVDNLTWNGLSGEKALIDLLTSKVNAADNDFALESRSTMSLFPQMLASQRIPKWMLSGDFQAQNNASQLPRELDSILNSVPEQAYMTLGDLGIHCGQGLRSGANEFFYLEIAGEADDKYSLFTSKWFGRGRTIEVPKKFIIRCVQNRRQVNGLVANPQTLEIGVLYLQDHIRPQDFNVCTHNAAERYKVLPNALNDYISTAEKYKNPRGISFREYSAVKPNEKKIHSQYERFWYMLHTRSRVHLPNLCITRVSSTAADCVYIPQSEENPIAVDANFVTLWGSSEEIIKICLALLNSTWSKCYLELLCTVMGGGALKIEASHVRQLLFPKLNHRQLQRLSKYGITIAKRQKITPELRNAIDATILESFTDEESLLMQIRALLRKKLIERGAKYEL